MSRYTLLICSFLIIDTRIVNVLHGDDRSSYDVTYMSECDQGGQGRTLCGPTYESLTLHGNDNYPRSVVDGGSYTYSDGYQCTYPNQGFADAVYSSTYVARRKPSGNLLPAPNEANDLFYSQLDYTQERLPDGTKPLVYSYFLGGNAATQDLWTRFKLLPSFGVFYDTGFVGEVFNAENIALGDPANGGQTTFTGENDLENVPISLLFDNQFLNALSGGSHQVQVYLETNNYGPDGEVELPHLYARVWNLESLNLAAGKAYSLFGVGGALPSTLSQASKLVGTGEFDDDDKRKQFRLQQTGNPGSFGWGVAVEDPFIGDLAAPAGAVTLTRWPSFAANAVFFGADKVDLVQVSSLVRSVGLETAGQEYFETLWGISAYALIGTRIDQESLEGWFAGIAGGEGVGQYVQGLSNSAVFDGAAITPLEGIGAYVGYKRQWLTPGNIEMGTNIAYGVASQESSPLLDAQTNENVQQAWANFLIYPSENVALGTEYQFGRRETIGDEAGENHRIMFVIALTTSPSKQEDRGFLTTSESADRSVTSNQGVASRQRF